MLMYYGGVCFAANKQRKLTDISDLWPGDVIMMGRQSSFYVTAIYQGNNKFLLNVQNRSSLTIDQKIWKNLYFASNDAFMAWMNSSVTDMAETLAPKSGGDPVDPPSEPSEPSEPSYRDITTGMLTDEERAAFAALVAEQWAANGGAGNVDKILIWTYNAIGVDITKAEGYTAKTVHNIFNYLFELPSGATYYALRAEDPADGASVFYHNIQMSDIYGGTIFESNVSLAENVDSLRVGDVFCARLRTVVDGKNQDRYWIGLYQGDGKFLTVHTTLEKVVLCDVISAAELDATAFQYYFVIRPEMLAVDYVEPNAPTGDVIGLVAAMFVLSGMAVVALKKKEDE